MIQRISRPSVGTGGGGSIPRIEEAQTTSVPLQAVDRDAAFKTVLARDGALAHISYHARASLFLRQAHGPAVESNFNLLMRDIHEANIRAGWWTDLATGESLIGKRNVAEMLMLMVTELEEAKQGRVTGEADDKLPQYRMHTVEIADALIRGFDLAGGTAPDLARVVTDNLSQPSQPAYHNLEDGVWHLARAFEGYRRGRQRTYEVELAWFFIWALRYADHNGMGNLFTAFSDKLAFNAKRADHKPENRAKADGKKI